MAMAHPGAGECDTDKSDDRGHALTLLSAGSKPVLAPLPGPENAAGGFDITQRQPFIIKQQAGG
jgi:hypothetical protein